MSKEALIVIDPGVARTGWAIWYDLAESDMPSVWGTSVERRKSPYDITDTRRRREAANRLVNDIIKAALGTAPEFSGADGIYVVIENIGHVRGMSKKVIATANFVGWIEMMFTGIDNVVSVEAHTRDEWARGRGDERVRADVSLLMGGRLERQAGTKADMQDICDAIALGHWWRSTFILRTTHR